jgi:hypothetical protein
VKSRASQHNARVKAGDNVKSWVFLALTLWILLSSSQSFAGRGTQSTSLSNAVAREIRQEADPRSDEQDCVSSGKVTIVYASNDSGVPNVAFQITDPRGRTIGYDPDTKRGWQEMPLAEAFLDCEQNDDTGELRDCKGHIEICGPISGTYQIEVLPTKNGKFSLNAWATSQSERAVSARSATHSQAEWKSQIHEHEQVILSLQYSRQAGTQIRLTAGDQHLADRTKDHPETSAQSLPTN